MSFILDALRKAEDKNRNRHTMTVPAGPRVVNETLPEAPPAKRSSAFALIITIAVVAALLGWLLLSQPGKKPAPATQSQTASTVAAAPRTADPLTHTPDVSATQQATPAGQSASTTRLNIQRDTGARALDQEARRGTPAPVLTASTRQSSNALQSSKQKANSDTGQAKPVTPGTVRILNADGSETPPVIPGRVEQETLPEYRTSQASGDVPIPNLHLDMHVYSAEPRKRFVFINLDKYGEGDTIDKDTAVESIEPQGAVINYKGYRFVLLPD